MSSVIELDDVTKVFRTGWSRNEVVAVHRLTFSVARSSVVAFVGPNGAGKTTTIHMLLGLVAPENGHIRVLGREPGSVEARRRLGYMAEIFRTYPFHTATRALSFYGRLAQMGDDEMRGRIPGLLARVGLGGAADRRVGGFSKGMMQRLGLAQALLHEPEVLVLDEPTTGLDPEGRRLVADIIDEERRRGTTVFLSSHILSDVERTCDRVVMIREGRLVLSSSLAELAAGTVDWEVEVAGMDDASRAELAGLGWELVDDGGDVCRVVTGPDRKQALLRWLVDRELEIGSVRRSGGSLEDLYLERIRRP